MDTEAYEIAWEQVACWRVFMTAAEAGRAVGLYRWGTDWSDVARRLAVLWRKLQLGKHPRVPQGVHRIAELYQEAA